MCLQPFHWKRIDHSFSVLFLQMYLNMQLQLGLKRFSELYHSVPLPGVPTDGEVFRLSVCPNV